MLTPRDLKYSPTREGVPSSDDNFTANDLVSAQDALENEAREVLGETGVCCTYDLGPLKQPVRAVDAPAVLQLTSLCSSSPASPASTTALYVQRAQWAVTEITTWWSCSTDATFNASVEQGAWARDPSARSRRERTRQ